VTAYYNEHDPKAAAWLRELIKQGHIAPGEVDERSVEDVIPDELLEFTQCHFFAGIGVWSHALRRAGWPDDRPVWTGSCPCQPFSAAGKRTGIDDERHLWPAWFHLISQCRPPTIFGEQVASKDGLGWLDLVQSDMEAARYAFGAFDLCAAGVGAPHIRQRLYFVADAGGAQRQGTRLASGVHTQHNPIRRDGAFYTLADANGRDACAEREQSSGEQRQQPQDGDAGGMADTESFGWAGRQDSEDGGRGQFASGFTCDAGGLADAARSGRATRIGYDGAAGHELHNEGRGKIVRPGPTNGFWGAADWLYCTDGKWRPVEPGTFPLAHGTPARVGRLRGYGNAIVAPLAQAFIEEFMSLSDA
jgi:DNA (cytosine-5)-methyltransferase 1